MKLLTLALVFALSIFPVRADEQPPYFISDPAIQANFERLFQLMDQHRHNDPDSSKPFDLIPDATGFYDLGTSTTPWRILYVGSAAIGGNGMTIPQAPLHVGAGTTTLTATNVQILNSQNTNSSAGIAAHNNMGVETVMFAESGLAGSVGTSSNHVFKFITNNSEIFRIPVSAVTTGGALCLNGDKVLTKCTSAVDASGNCTCP